jgi:hypothetical protein
LYQIWYTHIHFFENPLSKIKWKKLIKKQVHSYWREKIQEDCLTFSTLNVLNPKYNIGRTHPLLKSHSANMQDVSRIPIRLKIVTGTYILQTHRAKYSNDTAVSPLGTDHLTCKGGMVFRFVQNFFFGRHESQNIYFFLSRKARNSLGNDHLT